MRNVWGLFWVVVRFMLMFLLVIFLVGMGVKVGFREMVKNDILKYFEVYKNVFKLGMMLEEYYMKYIVFKKYLEFIKFLVVVGFNVFVLLVKFF